MKAFVFGLLLAVASLSCTLWAQNTSPVSISIWNSWLLWIQVDAASVGRGKIGLQTFVNRVFVQARANFIPNNVHRYQSNGVLLRWHVAC